MVLAGVRLVEVLAVLGVGDDAELAVGRPASGLLRLVEFDGWVVATRLALEACCVVLPFMVVVVVVVEVENECLRFLVAAISEGGRLRLRGDAVCELFAPVELSEAEFRFCAFC